MPDDIKIGPTGEFPEGALRPDDHGSLNAAMSLENGKIIMFFNTPVTWLAMSSLDARNWANGLLQYADMNDAKNGVVQPVAEDLPEPGAVNGGNRGERQAYTHDPMVQLSEQHIRVDNGQLYKLALTSVYAPEQYDVRDPAGKVMGYLRLRGGEFTAHYVPDPTVRFGWDEEPLYSADTEGDGAFEDAERGFHLSKAVQALHDRHTRA